MRCTTAYGLERWLSERAEGLPDRGQSRPVSAPQVAVCQIGHPGFRGNTLPPTNTYRRYWANACWMNCGDGFTRRKPEFWSESRMRENCTSGSMSGRGKRGMACGSEPPKGKPGYPDIPLTKPPRHLSTLPALPRQVFSSRTTWAAKAWVPAERGFSALDQTHRIHVCRSKERVAV